MSNYFSQKANILLGIYLSTWTVSVYAFTLTVAFATVSVITVANATVIVHCRQEVAHLSIICA